MAKPNRGDVRAQRELRELQRTEREKERRIEKALKSKQDKATQELESEQQDKRNRVGLRAATESGDSSTIRRVHPTNTKDEVAKDFRNSKLDYFQRKRNQNNTLRTRVKNAEEEHGDHRRREHNKLLWEAKHLMNLAQAEHDRQIRKRQESQQKESQKDIDYKSILRDARRTERSELNKALAEHEKLREHRLKDESDREHDVFEIVRKDLEADWELNDTRRAERSLARQRLRGEWRDLEHEHLEAKKETDQNLANNMEIEDKRLEEWALIYDLKSQPENLNLPQSIQDQILCNILDHIDEYGSDEDDLRRDVQRRRRKENTVNMRENRDIDKDVHDTKHFIAEKVLSRSKQHRRTIK